MSLHFRSDIEIAWVFPFIQCGSIQCFYHSNAFTPFWTVSMIYLSKNYGACEMFRKKGRPFRMKNESRFQLKTVRKKTWQLKTRTKSKQFKTGVWNWNWNCHVVPTAFFVSIEKNTEQNWRMNKPFRLKNQSITVTFCVPTKKKNSFVLGALHLADFSFSHPQ